MSRRQSGDDYAVGGIFALVLLTLSLIGIIILVWVVLSRIG